MPPMDIKWRGDDYIFQPTIIKGGKDRDTRANDVHQRIFGIDTESVELEGRYEPQCFTLSDETEDHLQYIPPKEFGLEYLMTWFAHYYAQELMGDKGCFAFLHNLSYDFPQLAKYDPKLVEMIKVGVGLEKEYPLFSNNRYKFALDKKSLFVGTAAHFTINIYEGRDKLSVKFRDTFSYFPSSLDSVAKSLGMDVEKMERQEDLGLRDYRIEADSEAKREFEEYAKIDSRITQNAGEKIRELHVTSEMKRIRPSAPGFAVTTLFQTMEEDERIVTGDWRQEVMQLIFDTYRGGRTGGIYHGAIEKCRVFDFHSSYPASMCSLPTFSETTEYIKIEGDDLTWENVFEILKETGNVFLRVSGIETDDKYPAIITTLHGKLTPVYGEFHNIATTGVELMVGVLSGTLTITEVHECVVIIDTDENVKNPFRTFAQDGYTEKAEAEPSSVDYIKAKLKLNSAYGKLIESRHQTLVAADDETIYLPYIPGMEKDFGQMYYEKYLDAVAEEKSLEDIYPDILDELIENFGVEAVDSFDQLMFCDYSLSGKIYGKFVVPAAASLITATSRARLCAFIKCMDAIYWDTDSGFIPSDITNVDERLSLGTTWLTPGTLPLTVGDKLGELDMEIWDADGWLAGTKRYYLEGQGLKKGKVVFKIKAAIHGIPAIPIIKPDEEDDDETAQRKYNTYRKEVISMLGTGNDYKYESKPRPLKTKEAGTAENIGMFRSKTYKPYFRLDERLEWTRFDNHWKGSVLPYHELMERKFEQNEDAIRAAKTFFEGRD